ATLPPSTTRCRSQEVAQLVVLQREVQHPQHRPQQQHSEHEQARGEQQPGRGAAAQATAQRDGAAGEALRSVPPVLVEDRRRAHSEKKPSISAAAASAASWTGVPPRMSPSSVSIVFAPSILPPAGLTGTDCPPSASWRANTSGSSAPAAATSSSASVVPGKWLGSSGQRVANPPVVTRLSSSKASSGCWVSVKRHIREPPRKEGATGPSLAGRVKATSFSPSSKLSCRIVAGVHDPETNIGTFSWTKAASASVSFQVAAAAVEALCSRARSAYH